MVIAANGKAVVPDGIVLANGQSREVAGVHIEAVGAYDLTPGELFHPKGEANGYILTIGGKRIYVASVTECVPEVRAVRNIDIAFFPMNVLAERMEPAEAVECLAAIRPRVVYPYHYDQEWVRRLDRDGTRSRRRRGACRRSRTACDAPWTCAGRLVPALANGCRPSAVASIAFLAGLCEHSASRGGCRC